MRDRAAFPILVERRYRLGVRTDGSQPSDRGSNPRSATILTEPLAATLTVARASPEDAGHRQVFIFLDGEPWATLLNGESATREVLPGRHVVKADNTLTKRSLEFRAAAGDHVRFTVVNRPGPAMWLFMLLGSPLFRLTLKRD